MAPLAIPLMLAGTGLQAYGQYQAGAQQKAIDDYNARVKELEARTEEQRSIIESRKQAAAAARKMSELRAGLGASGAVSSVGTPLEILAEQARESEKENIAIGQEGVMAAQRAREQAKMLKYEGKAAKRAGIISAGTSLLTGFSSAFDMMDRKAK